MIVKTVMDLTNQSASPNTSDAVDLEMPKGNRGIFQIQCSNFTGISSLEAKLQGRLSDDMGWQAVDNATLTRSTNGTVAAEDIQLYPQIRVQVTVTASGGDPSYDIIAQLGC